MLKKSLIVTILSFAASSWALDLSNPSSPVLPQEGLFIPQDFFLGVHLEYQAQKVFDKSLHASSPFIRKALSFEEEIQMGLLSFTLAHQFEVYVGLGANRIQLATEITDLIIHEYSTGNKFRWEVGAKGQIFSYDKGALALDLKYACTHPTIQAYTINGALDPHHLKMKYDEWQLGLAGSYTFDFFTPYLGVRYSHPTIKIRRFTSGILPDSRKAYKIDGQKKFGLSVGVTMAALKGFALNLEFNAIDENAVSLTAFLSF